MSATNRPRRGVAVVDRDPLDRFLTPDDVAAKCVGALGDLTGLRAVEPSAGGGAFVRALLAAGCASVYPIDVDPGAGAFTSDMSPNDHWVGDWLAWHPTGGAPDLVVGNPPFSAAEDHVRRALSVVAPGGVVGFLLRLAFLEGQRRRALWRNHPPVEVHVLSKRPSFTGGGTDASAYAFMVWRRGVALSGDRPRLGWL